MLSDLPKCYSYRFVMVLTVVGLLMTMAQPNSPDKMQKVAMGVLWLFLYHFIFGWLCKNKYYNTSWVLALLPIILTFIVVNYMVGFMDGLMVSCEERNALLNEEEDVDFSQVWMRNQATR